MPSSYLNDSIVFFRLKNFYLSLSHWFNFTKFQWMKICWERKWKKVHHSIYRFCWILMATFTNMGTNRYFFYNFFIFHCKFFFLNEWKKICVDKCKPVGHSHIHWDSMILKTVEKNNRIFVVARINSIIYCCLLLSLNSLQCFYYFFYRKEKMERRKNIVFLLIQPF